MKIPFKLQTEIIDFLISLPNLEGADNQRAFIARTGLDKELESQLIFDKPLAQFISLLVTVLIKYGELHDGRNALKSVLETAKGYVGREKKAYCDTLIHQISKRQTQISVTRKGAQKQKLLKVSHIQEKIRQMELEIENESGSYGTEMSNLPENPIQVSLNTMLLKLEGNIGKLIHINLATEDGIIQISGELYKHHNEYWLVKGTGKIIIKEEATFGYAMYGSYEHYYSIEIRKSDKCIRKFIILKEARIVLKERDC